MIDAPLALSIKKKNKKIPQVEYKRCRSLTASSLHAQAPVSARGHDFETLYTVVGYPDQCKCLLQNFMYVLLLYFYKYV